MHETRNRKVHHIQEETTQWTLVHLAKARAKKAKASTVRAKAEESNDSKDSTDRTRTRTRIRLNVGIVENVDTTRKTVGARRTPKVVRKENTNPRMQMLAILTRNHQLLNQKLKLMKSLGFKRILVRSDNERSLLSLIERMTCNLTGVELVLRTSPEGDHQANGLAEVGVREIKARTRILRSHLEQRLGSRIDEKDPLMSWIPRHAANYVSKYRIMDDGRTPDQRRCGKTWKRPVVELGESVHFRPVGENNGLRGGNERMLRGVHMGQHERSGSAIFLTPDGVKRGTRISRMLEHERWDRVFSASCVGVPWQLRPDQRNLETCCT